MTKFGRAIGRAFLGAVAVAAATLFPSVSASAGTLPFTDPEAVGFIGLCNQAGKPVTSGSLLDDPVVWTAVSSTPAPKGFAQGKATLYAYSPRQYEPPGEWGGEQITGSSTFTNPAHPIAQSTNGDPPLVSYVGGYPPLWNGLIQLRMYYTGPGGDYTAPYPATVIRVKGESWSVVSGGDVGCNLGKGTSDEAAVPPRHVVLHTGTVPPNELNGRTSTTTAGSSKSTGAAGHGSTTTQPTGASRPNGSGGTLSASAATQGGSGAGGLSGGAIAAIVIGCILIAGAAGVLIYRRLRPPTTHSA